MKLIELQQILDGAGDAPVVFFFDDYKIRRDYHITEVMAVTTKTIDCGSELHEWTDTVLQLIEPAGDGYGRSYMEGRKAAGILGKSVEVLDLDPQSEVILEFRGANDNAAGRYQIAGIESEAGAVHIKGQGTVTQCKPMVKEPVFSNIKAPAQTSSGCCGPATGANGGCC